MLSRIFHCLRKFQRQPPPAKHITPEILNRALLKYVKISAQSECLQRYISRSGLEHHTQEIFTTLDDLLNSVERFLWDYPGGVPWTKQFEKEYSEMLVQNYPWLNKKSIERVFGFSRWLCWHEGLNARDVD